MTAMHRPLLALALLVALFHCDVAQQIQMPEAGALHLPEEGLEAQVMTLQKNVSELWTYIFQLRSAVTQHLNHLRQHQVELEDVVHKMSHYHDGQGEGTHASHTDDHHHSGEQHSHSSDHSHGDGQHSHSGEHHSHGDDHHHSGEHSHGGDDHSHGSHDHSHGSHDHYHESHSHSHSHEGHSSHEEGDGHHHHDHKDSHEKEDDLQQSQQGADLQQVPQGPGPVAEPVIVPSTARSHNSHVTSGSSRFKPLPLMNNYHHHHHHDHEHRRNRSRVVIMPKYSEYDLYEFAVCNVQPNRAIPAEQQQEITGQVTLWQRKMGGSLNLHVRLQGFDMGDHHGHHQQVQQEDDNETPAPIVHKHGFHVHSSGDLSNGCQSTGSHYNPKNANHGGPNSLVRHVGDLGNIECDDHGVANLVFSDDVASLKGPYSIFGKALVIHALQDDFGLGGNEESLRTGNAGTRLACCVIEKVDKLPIRAYKAIKTAKQYQN